MKNSAGILQADAYTGFKALYEIRADGSAQFREAACWAHLRRDFHDIWTGTKSEIAKDALDRIGQLYDIEREIKGQLADERYAVRQHKTKPKVEAFHAWAEAQLTRIPGKSDLAKAFRYGLSRWSSFTLFLEDGRVAIDNNAAERGMRPIGVGHRNWLFAGSMMISATWEKPSLRTALRVWPALQAFRRRSATRRSQAFTVASHPSSSTTLWIVGSR